VRPADLKSVACHHFLGRLDRHLTSQLIGENSFVAFARCRQNGFVGLTGCFMTVSRQHGAPNKLEIAGKTAASGKKTLRQFDDVTRLK